MDIETRSEKDIGDADVFVIRTELGTEKRERITWRRTKQKQLRASFPLQKPTGCLKRG